MRPREFLPHDAFDLREPVGDGRPNRPEDVATVERLLNRVGQPPLGPDREPTGLFSVPLRDSIHRFQCGNRLRDDGIVNPDGETFEALRARASERPPGAPELDPRKRAECQDIQGRMAETAAEIAARELGLEQLEEERERLLEALDRERRAIGPFDQTERVRRLMAAIAELDRRIEKVGNEIELLEERQQGLNDDLQECQGTHINI